MILKKIIWPILLLLSYASCHPSIQQPLEETSIHNRGLQEKRRSIVFNLDKCKEDAQDWTDETKEQFQTPYMGLPQLCGPQNDTVKHLIVAAEVHRDDEEPWLPEIMPKPFMLYEADNCAAPHHHWNGAKEAMAYLKFIAEYYDCLPEVTLFVHSHRGPSWIRFPTLDMLFKSLRWEAVTGFAMLNPEKHRTTLLRHPAQNLIGHEVLPPYGFEPRCAEVINGTVYQKQPVQEYRNSKLVRRFWDLFLGSWLGEMPEGVSWQRGAEFLVSKSRILAHPRRFYIDALSFLAEYPKVGIGLGPGGTRPIARMTSSDLQIAFERLWPYLFGEPAMFENPSIARCDLFICEGDL